MSRLVATYRLPLGGVRVKNSDFEDQPAFTAATTTSNAYIDGTASGSTTNNAYGWGTSTVTAGASAQYDTSVSYSGTGSMKLSTTDTSGLLSVITGRSSTFSVGGVYDFFRILPSTTYTVTMRVKTSTVATNAVYFTAIEYSATGTLGTQSNATAISGTNDWTLLTKTFTTAATAAYMALVLRNAVAGNVGSAWFDDIRVTQSGVTRTAAV
jgi:hypothetical protein